MLSFKLVFLLLVTGYKKTNYLKTNSQIQTIILENILGQQTSFRHLILLFAAGRNAGQIKDSNSIFWRIYRQSCGIGRRSCLSWFLSLSSSIFLIFAKFEKQPAVTAFQFISLLYWSTGLNFFKLCCITRHSSLSMTNSEQCSFLTQVLC